MQLCRGRAGHLGPGVKAVPGVCDRVSHLTFRGQNFPSYVSRTIIVPEDGEYFMRFLVGSYDETNLRAVGAQLRVMPVASLRTALFTNACVK